MWRRLSRSLRPTVIWQLKLSVAALPSRTYFQRSKKNFFFFINWWFSIAESFNLAVPFAFPIYCWFNTWAIALLPSRGCKGESQRCRSMPWWADLGMAIRPPPASPQTSRDEEECSVGLMKFGFVTTIQLLALPIPGLHGILRVEYGKGV